MQMLAVVLTKHFITVSMFQIGNLYGFWLRQPLFTIAISCTLYGQVLKTWVLSYVIWGKVDGKLASCFEFDHFNWVSGGQTWGKIYIVTTIPLGTINP